MELITQIGVPGALVLIILREVFGFLKDRRDKPAWNGTERRIGDLIKEHGCDFRRQARIDERLTGMEQLLSDIGDRSTRMYEMHDQRDEDGVPVWHVRTSMRAEIKRMVALLEELVRLAKEDQRRRGHD